MAAPATVAWVQSTPFGDLGVLLGPDGVERISMPGADLDDVVRAAHPGTAGSDHDGRRGGWPASSTSTSPGAGPSSTSRSTSTRPSCPTSSATSS